MMYSTKTLPEPELSKNWLPRKLVDASWRWQISKNKICFCCYWTIAFLWVTSIQTIICIRLIKAQSTCHEWWKCCLAHYWTATERVDNKVVSTAAIDMWATRGRKWPPHNESCHNSRVSVFPTFCHRQLTMIRALYTRAPDHSNKIHNK